ncbi:Cytochrome P450 monooxygenase rdc4 [Lasiodiplodia theobromae]|uniref:Cytochrome P450 monooxygenase rdc4 n=1 Tax=Lasiodiplodia theobromae TaxID=45133 RepID=A0A5N5D7S6_9PEZI|nr:Cytochrome P450 monooxygenase rdc4 [Lasiodiplodia theobromae]
MTTYDKNSSPEILRSFTELPSTSQILLLSTLSVLVFVATKLLYNIYFHPLAKFPGPKHAAATDLVYWYHWCTGSVHTYIEDVHAQYGEIVRITPYRLSFIDPQAWKDIYGHKTAAKKGHLHKEPNFYQPDYNGRDSVLTKKDDHEHSRVRKIFTNAFSDRALKAQEPILKQYIDKFIDIIRHSAVEKPGTPIDTVKLLNCLTFDVIGDLAFGESLGLLETAEYNEWLSTIFGGIKNLAATTFLLEYPLLGAVASLFVPKSLKESQKFVFDYCATRVEKRMAKGAVTEKPDFWSLALAQHDKGALDLEDMKANAGLFMVAGSETTATMLSGLFYNLLMNPDKMKKLVSEVRGAFASEDELTIENIQSLTYLAACFNESLRVYPSVPQGPPRVMEAGGGIISGHFVPENTRLSLAQYSAYHSPTNFKDPLSFIPERWLTDDPLAAEFANDRKDVLQPFSYGPRNCIGKK